MKKNSVNKTILLSVIFCLILIPVVILVGNQANRCMYTEKLTHDPFDAEEISCSVYLPVLIYHHFQEESPTENGLTVSRSSFDDQMKALKENGYTAVSAPKTHSDHL